MVIKPEIIWSKRALKQFKDIYDYINNESPSGATTVRDAVMNTLEMLPSNPEMFEKDRFKEINDGTYRAFTVFHCRIAYKISASKILILKVMHTSQEPKDYE